MTRIFTQLSLLIFWLTVLVNSASACPTCKEGFGNASVEAYGWSIIFMMSMPYTILTFFAIYVLYNVRKSRIARGQHALTPDQCLLELAKQKAALGIPTQPPTDA
ncbi:MAG: hypothetical protein COA78_13165 [Blastopirellula sp.]|nr:MAG: hypothetical protein COA78_13165 [Blastopirellula sp.]